MAATAVLVLSGCVAPPPPRPVYQAPPPPPPPVVTVYAYPLHGQTSEQQDRDHYECSQWSTQQTGFDPSAPGVPPHDRVMVASGPPPGTNTAIGAVAGALLGAVIAPRWQAAPAAIAGAVVGGAIGSTADAANAATNAQNARTMAMANQQTAAAQEHNAGNYRRALSACLDARGYSVK
ncbi:MAG: glycine zipper 2TM domain-containing protein [Steroidobacteraceae bacterium]